MKALSRFLSAVFAIGVFLVCAGSAFAQGGSSAAQLNGTVTDPSGGSVAGATLTVRNTDTNTTYTATSNDRGAYFVANLTPGNYELKVSYTGFANYTQTGIVLTVGQAATINVALQVATQGERVVVTTEVQTIEPTKTEISQVVNTEQIASLPISGRLFTDFALLTPGVATSRTSLGTTFTEYEATQISFGGMRSFSNEITVDGADFVNAASGVQRSTPPQDSVQEFRVVNNSFGAESGRALGGIVNIVTKSGTNDLHGSVYEYFQNSFFDSRNLLQKREPQLQSVLLLPHTLQQNQFGATLGGPIQKDKTFFFINYEGKRHAESPLYPPDLVNNLDVIDEAKKLMGLAPEGCGTGLALCTLSNEAYLKSFLKTSNNDYGFARLDHQFNANNHMALRYNVEDSRNSGELVGQTLDGGGIGTPSGGRDLFIRDQSVVGTLDSVLKPNLVNTALVQYARRHYNFPGMTGQPDFSILNDLELGHNFGTDDRIYESRFQFADSISWVKGNHVAKFGFDGNKIWSLLNFPGFEPVRVLMPTGAGGLAAACLADFAKFYNTSPLGSDANLPTSPALNAQAAACPIPGNLNGVVQTYAGVPVGTDPNFTIGPPQVLASNGTNLDTTTWANAFPPQLFPQYGKAINHAYWGLFAQDQWRITPKLTLNFGLRWDYESGLSTFVNPDYAGWQPRVGLAWSPDSKTVVRAGFGIFDDRYNLTFFFVPATQKTVPGYLCNPSTTVIAPGVTCADAKIQAQLLPMVQAAQAKQGYTLLATPPSNTAGAPVAASIISSGGYDLFNPVSMIGTCFTTNACGGGSGGMDHKRSKIPYAEQASLEVDHQFGAGFAVNVGYLFVAAHRLVRGNNLNVPCPLGTTDSAQVLNPTDPLPEWAPGLLNQNGTLSKCPDITDPSGHPTLGTGALAGLGPWFEGAVGSGLQNISAGLIDYNNGVANSVYHGGTITAIERIKNFNLTANYTYSHTIDNGNFTTFINLPINQFDYAAERSNSNQDARHRLVTNFTATGPADMWWTRHFTLSSIITLQAGRPFTMFYGNNSLHDLAGGATDRVGGAPLVGRCVSASDCATQIARNTYIGDPLYSWDFHLARYFQLRESLRLDLSVDAFNLLNRSNVDEVTSVYGSPVFCGGVIPKHYRDATSRAIQATAPSTACPAGQIPVPGGTLALTPLALDLPPGAPGTAVPIPNNPNNTFGLPRTMLNPRQFQFAAKFLF